ncbi:hypothetical protein BH11PLA1_BH11PLA1_17390 [soil metagenome]
MVKRMFSKCVAAAVLGLYATDSGSVACVTIGAPSAETSASLALPVSADASIAHLPAVLQRDITAWRARLADAKCIMVTMRTDESWVALDELDGQGTPKVRHRERFEVVSWMTPGSVWMRIYAVGDGETERTRPAAEMYFSAADKKVWQRYGTVPEGKTACAVEACVDEAGPENFQMASKGCIFATGTQSLLSGAARLSERASTKSLGLFREPELAMVPPDAQSGVWLDVFRREMVRNESKKSDTLYRRRDLMLLARNAAAEPEVREWRTVVVGDQKAGGKQAQMITGIRRFEYEFVEALPAGVETAQQEFMESVERAVAREKK